MRKAIGMALFVVVAFAQLLAQQSATSDDPATKEEVEKMFTTMHIREQMRNMMQVMAKQSKQMTHDALKKKMPDITEKDLDRIDAISDATFKDMDTDGMIEDMIPIYQRHLTKADVAAMLAFYETPTGQKLLREQPQMTAEAMQAVRPRMEKMMARVMDVAEKAARESNAESEKSGEAKDPK